MNVPEDTPVTAGAAIARLLEAEQKLRESLLEAQRQSAAILESAARQAAEIARRAEQRTLAVHGRCAGALEQRLQQRPGGAVSSPKADAADARLDLAVARVASWLTGAADDGGH